MAARPGPSQRRALSGDGSFAQEYPFPPTLQGFLGPKDGVDATIS